MVTLYHIALLDLCQQGDEAILCSCEMVAGSLCRSHSFTHINSSLFFAVSSPGDAHSTIVSLSGDD